MIRTRACDVLGIEHPIVQAGMSGEYTSAALVAAGSAAGGRGVVGWLWSSAEWSGAGIAEGGGVAGRLCRGAQGVGMGTRLLATPESPARTAHKQAILRAQSGDTVASSMFDILWDMDWPGVQARASRNRLTARWVG